MASYLESDQRLDFPLLNPPKVDEDALLFLRELVEIPSSTRNPLGVNQVQDKIEARLKRMGFTPLRVSSDEPGYGQLLIAQLDAGKKRTVTMVFHADTVTEGAPGEKRFQWDKRTNLAVGPGIADDKAGIVVALRGLELFLKSETPNFNIQIISSPNEELGSKGLLDKFRNLGQSSWMCLGFEPALDNGNIISSRHGNRWLDISIKGREAHSGRAQGEEINAAHEFAQKLTRLLQLKEKHPKTKINIGSVRSDKDHYNVVCGRIQAKLDLRFENNSTRDALTSDVFDILGTPFTRSIDGVPAECTWKMADDCPSFSNNSDSLPFVQSYVQLLSSLEGKTVSHQHSGGASDLNHVTPDGAIAIDGLGAVGGKIHTNQEFINVETLGTRSRALSFFLSEINQSG